MKKPVHVVSSSIHRTVEMTKLQTWTLAAGGNGQEGVALTIKVEQKGLVVMKPSGAFMARRSV